MTEQRIKIATLLTCHNRKQKTVASLRCLYNAIHYYYKDNAIEIDTDLYVTDDGCTDGTVEAVKEEFTSHPICIIKSDGNAFWAGGMRMAWRKAVESSKKYDYYLLLNDDCKMKEDCFVDLFSTDSFVRQHYNQPGIYCGFISSEKDESTITYGAKYYNKSWRAAAIDMLPTGIPQKCSMTNANILLVSANVVDSIGILDEGFIHSGADFDYGMRASLAGFPVFTSSGVCGYCEMDHDDGELEYQKVKKMSLKERKAFLDKPTRHYRDSLLFFKRYYKGKYYMLKFAYWLNLFSPKLFYYFFKKRGH